VDVTVTTDPRGAIVWSGLRCCVTSVTGAVVVFIGTIAGVLLILIVTAGVVVFGGTTPLGGFSEL
jgi:hypothetical protein